MSADSSPSAASRSRLLAALAAIVAASGIATLLGVAAPEVIWLPASGTPPGFSPVDPAPVQVVWPAVGSAVGLGAALLAVMDGALEWTGLAALLGPGRVVGAAVALAAFVVARRHGSSLAAATAAALGLSFGGVFWIRAATAQPGPIAALFSLLTIAGLVRWQAAPRTPNLAAVVISFAMATAVQPAVLGALPVVLWAVRRGGLSATGAVCAGATAGGAGFVWSLGGAQSMSQWFAPQGWSTVLGRLVPSASAFSAEFGLLGIVFVILGGVALVRRPASAALLFGWSAGPLVWALLWAPPDWRGALLPAFAPLWIVAAVGMTHARDVAGTRAARTGVVAVSLLLPLLNLAAHVEAGTRARAAAELADRYLDQWRGTLPPGTAIVAESTLVDRRIAAWAAETGAVPLTRIPQTAVAIDAARSEGRPVVALAEGRRNLEALGYRFIPMEDAGLALSVPEFLSSIPDDWIVAVGTGPGFSSALTEPGPVFAAAGGEADLFGRTRWHYGLVGVAGHGHRVIERAGPAPVDLIVGAAESLGPHMRSPVALRVRSRDQGASVEYRNQVVASTATGIAMAVVTPAGELAGAFDSEFGSDMRVRVDPPGFSPATLSGREPCVALATGRWTDVSAVTQLSSLSTVVAPGQALEVYVAAAHPLDPRELVLERPSNVDWAVRTFESSSQAGREALQQRLLADGASEAAARLPSYPFVYRIAVRAPRVGRRLLALRLGGFAPAGFARSDGSPLGAGLCASMRRAGGRPVSVRAARAELLRVDASDEDLFVGGWHEAERSGASTFRWTSRAEAEVLLPVLVPQAAILSLVAGPLRPQGATLSVRVNDMVLEPVVMEPLAREYRFDVPAEVWRAGLNRLWIRSAVATPASLGLGEDDRPLGVSVEVIRLLIPPSPAGG